VPGRNHRVFQTVVGGSSGSQPKACSRFKYEKYGFRKLCTFPHFFKINGEYVDFDLMNLELNTADDHIEGNMR